jgi:hypothetical protein
MPNSRTKGISYAKLLQSTKMVMMHRYIYRLRQNYNTTRVGGSLAQMAAAA